MKKLSLFPPLAALVVSAPGLRAQDGAEKSAAVAYSRASIVERSPFAQSARARRSGSGDPLELRGFYGSGPGLQVSLTRPDTKESAWITVGDKNAKWVVETADAEAGTADVNFDGLKLHLTLAKAEVPELTESRRGPGGGGRWGGNMSEEGRQAMRDAMRSGFERARSEHPEWFDGRTLSEDQQNARRQYMTDGWNRTREAVAKVSQVDAQQMGDAPPFMTGGGPRPGGDNTASSSAAVTINSARTGGNNPGVSNNNENGGNNNAGNNNRIRRNRGTAN